MSIVQDLRERIETKLDRWEAQASAIKAQLDLGIDKALARVQSRKHELGDTLERLKKKIQEEKGLAATMKSELVSKIEHLRVQMALAKAETRDVYEEQKEKIASAVMSVEQEIDKLESNIGRQLHALTQEFVRRSDVLRAELDAAGIQYHRAATAVRARFEESKWELGSQIDTFQKHLAEARERAHENAAALEGKLSVAIAKIREAFRHVQSGTESAANGKHAVDTEVRERMIREAAYYHAEHRGFCGGDPMEDWLVAEAEIEGSMPSCCGDSIDDEKRGSGANAKQG